MSDEPIKDEYKGLPGLLHAVRWSQRLLAIIAEVLILVAFAMSGMDVSLGGVMASIPLLKILWAAMFAWFGRTLARERNVSFWEALRMAWRMGRR